MKTTSKTKQNIPPKKVATNQSTPHVGRVKLKPLSDFTNAPPKYAWLIKNHMELNSLGMIFGAPGSGKSFLAMDISYCVAEGIDWNNNLTQQGKVVYIAGEGHSGIGKRFKALEHKYGMVRNNIYFTEMPISLLDKTDVNALFQEIKKICPDPKLIVFDTLHSNFGGGDENSAKDIGMLLYHLKVLKKAANSSILIVHHSGHSSSGRGRGSSSIKGALDVEYKVVNNNGVVTVECTKAKDFEEPGPVAFNIKSHPIAGWVDQDKNQITSAYLEPAVYVQNRKQPAITSQDQLVLDALRKAIVNSGSIPPISISSNNPSLNGKNYVRLKDWQTEAYAMMNNLNGTPRLQGTNRTAFTRAKDKFLKLNIIAEDNGYFWEIVQ